MVTEQNCGVEDLQKMIWAGCECPLEKLVVDAAGAWCGLVGGFGQRGCNLFLCDFWEVLGGKGVGVVQLDWGDLGTFRDEEMV